jgi:2-haloacid dehalogenase
VNAAQCRLSILAVATSLVVALSASPGDVRRTPVPAPSFKAVAFDYLVLFNPDSIIPEVERVFPGEGRALTTLWRTRQFEYSWLRSMTGRYADFFAIAEDSLVYAANALNLQLTPQDKRRLLDAYLRLDPWPDTANALQMLRNAGMRIITVTNFTPTMLRANADHAGLTGYFDAFVSTDVLRLYKPDPRAYELGVNQLHLDKHDILFAAFGGWDAAGAKSFGYPTFWVNRLNQPFEELGVRPDKTSPTLDGLLDFVLSRNPHN